MNINGAQIFLKQRERSNIESKENFVKSYRLPRAIQNYCYFTLFRTFCVD